MSEQHPTRNATLTPYQRPDRSEIAARYHQARETIGTKPSSASHLEFIASTYGMVLTSGIGDELDIAQNLEMLEQAHNLVHQEGSAEHQARVLYWLGRTYYDQAVFSSALAYAQESLAIAESLDDDRLMAPPTQLMGRIYCLQSDYLNAVEILTRSVEQMARLEDWTEEALAMGLAGVVCGYLGEFERALSYANHSLTLSQRIGNVFAQAAAYSYRAMIHEQRGMWTEAVSDCERARRLAEQEDDRFRLYLITLHEGWARTMAGDPAAGCRLLEDGLRDADGHGSRLFLSWGKTYLAASRLALGERDIVPALCYETIRLADDLGEDLPKAIAHRTLSEALMDRLGTHSRQANRAIEEAIRLQKVADAKPELARSYASYASLLDQQDNRARAGEYRALARDMFRQMGMAWDLERVEAMAKP